jgi:hypothetical protein
VVQIVKSRSRTGFVERVRQSSSASLYIALANTISSRQIHCPNSIYLLAGQFSPRLPISFRKTPQQYIKQTHHAQYPYHGKMYFYYRNKPHIKIWGGEPTFSLSSKLGYTYRQIQEEPAYMRCVEINAQKDPAVRYHAHTNQ